MREPAPNVVTGEDGDLLRRARAGDRFAFDAIVRNHHAPAIRLATVISGDSTEAHDIVQDAFVRAHHALATVREGEALRPWLMRIVANQAKNANRSRRRRDARHTRHAALRAAEPSGPDEIALSDIEAQQLLAAISQLSKIDRTIVACRYFAGLDEAETARALGIARGTVKSRTSRALTRLRRQLVGANE